MGEGGPKRIVASARDGISIPDMPNITPEMASKILDADRLNIIKKTASGKPLSARERSIMESVLAGDDAGSVTVAKSKSQAATLLKISRPTLYAWIEKMEDKGLKPVRDNGEVEIMEIRRFMRAGGAHAGERVDDSDDITELNKVRAKLLLLKLEDAQLTLAHRKGELLDMGELLKQTAEAFGTIRYLMLARWDTLSVSMAGHTVPEIKKRGRSSDIEILMQFSGGDWPPQVIDMVKQFLLWLEVNDKR